MDFIRCLYILVACSSTLVRRRAPSVFCVYRIGRATNVRYVIAQHLVIINTFTSFHSITAQRTTPLHSTAQYSLCQLILLYTLCLCIWIDSLYTFVKKNVSAQSETRESCNEFSFPNLFHIAYYPPGIYVQFKYACAAILSLSARSLCLSPCSSLGVLEFVCVRVPLLLHGDEPFSSFHSVSFQLVLSSSSLNSFHSGKCYKWSVFRSYVLAFGRKWMNGYMAYARFKYYTLCIFYRRKRPNMKLNHSKSAHYHW